MNKLKSFKIESGYLINDESLTPKGLKTLLGLLYY